MILTANYGENLALIQAENKLEAALSLSDYSDCSEMFRKASMSILKNEYLFDKKFGINDDFTKLYGRLIMSEGQDDLEKLNNFTSEVINEIHDRVTSEKNEKEAQDAKSRFNEKLEKKVKDIESKRTRSDGKTMSQVREMDVANFLDSAFKIIASKSKSNTRERTKLKLIKDIPKMAKSQSIFGKNILMYKAVKKSLKGRVKNEKESLYISIDNSGSMTSYQKKLKESINKILKPDIDVFYSTWNESLNFDFKKLNGSLKFFPDGNDNIYRSSKDSIEKTPSNQTLIIISDGTTYLEKDECIELLDKSSKKGINFYLLTLGSSSNYSFPSEYSDRLLCLK